MVELIFAIVVIGITLMQAPTLIAQAGKSATVAYMQESIAIAATHTNQLLSYAWDEQNTDQYHMNILNVSATGDSELNPDTTLRVVRASGGAASAFASSRVRLFHPVDLPAASAALGLDTNESAGTEDDVDDFDGATTTLQVHTANNTNDGEYIDKNISIATAINYSSDAANYDNNASFTINSISNTAAGGSTNIKYVTTTLTTTSTAEELSKSIVLRGFMCNIGSARLESRSGI